ncbi:V-type ATP synthase subunit D [Marinoscillum sp.]|uniref:V-type ATP synthase subunit D n=1 Tax=Marinoscillum sp. TaxID=2024838 RepID=UPI003BAC92C1
MAIKFHYNKSTVQQFQKQLTIREKALPILKNKETALRQEEKKAKSQLRVLRVERSSLEDRLIAFQPFWCEFPDIVTLEDPGVYQKKIVGVNLPEIGKVSFKIADISWWNYPAWLPAGIDLMQRVITLDLQIKFKTLQIDLLDAARKRTTQKVNLYEKVQIPTYEDAILKIKRFLEDKENISKAAMKIVKNRTKRREAV